MRWEQASADLNVAEAVCSAIVKEKFGSLEVVPLYVWDVAAPGDNEAALSFAADFAMGDTILVIESGSE